MSTLTISIKQKASGDETFFEGSYQLPGSTTAKLARKEGGTKFPTRAALNQVARKLAGSLGWELAYEEPAKKAAAKKSVKSRTKKAAEATAESQPSN